MINFSAISKHIFFVFLILIFILLQYKLWLAPGGILEMRELSKQARQQEEHNLELERHNLALEAEVDDLKRGEDALEEYARSELGMVKDDEVFYRVVNR